MKPTGYLVMESCDDYEQALVLRTGDALPPGGILDWGRPCAVFAVRQDARDAINSTEHYRLAFGRNLPEKKFCSIVPAVLIPTQEPK